MSPGRALLKKIAMILTILSVVSPPGTGSAEGMGQWVVDSEFDEFDGDIYSAHLIGEKSVLLMMIRCRLNETDIIIMQFPGRYMLSTDLRVQYRLNGESVHYNHNMSTDNEAIFLARPTHAIKQWFSKQRLAIRITERDGDRHQDVFMLEGIEAAISDIRENCNW